ncbi:MAG: SHOCT domain-containing protein [Clostridia bacterium]|nr:SHOCT domain-containing protein [Clostridia bacterium]
MEERKRMDEKELIRSKQSNYRLISWLIGLSGVVLSILFVLILLIYHSTNPFIGRYGPIYSSPFEELKSNGALIAVPFVIIAFAVLGLLFYKMCSKVSIVVTDKRVYGTSSWGRRVDIPLDSISAVGIGAFKSIAVTSASGALKFALIANRNEVHKVISNLLIERQKNKSAFVVKETPAPKSDIPEDLKKYKELLDSGVITQEEFDAKKKQLLGL